MVEIAEQCRKGGSHYLNFHPNKKWNKRTYIQWGRYRHHHVDANTGKMSHPYFMEVFPKNPDTFIRVTGLTLDDVEEKAWKLLNKYKSCPKHKFERRDFRNGAGFCKHCNLFKSKAFEPSTKCIKCKKPTNYACDINDDWYCEKHKHLIPNELKTRSMIVLGELEEQFMKADE